MIGVSFYKKTPIDKKGFIQIIRELAAAGYDTDRTMGVYPGSSWTIVDGEDTLGVNLNIKPVR